MEQVKQNLRLKELRLSRKCSQQQIADMLYITQSVYSKYEKGIVRVPIGYMVKLSRFYNVSVDYLCGLTDDSKPFPKSIRFAKLNLWPE